MPTTTYEGPAGVILTKEEWLQIWVVLNRTPTGENAEIRRKIKRYLEREGA